MNKYISTFLLVSMLSTGIIFAASKTAAEPNYTKGEKLEGKEIYNSLGAIGAIGNIWSTNSTSKTRTIQIRELLKGTPADGKLKVNDVILGVVSPKLSQGIGSNNLFNQDVRIVLSSAITEAEKAKNGGKLVLYIWRTGKKMSVELKLPVMGSYSNTSPWKCAKTEKVINAAVKSILEMKAGRKGKMSTRLSDSLHTNALGLLATGDKKHWPLIGKHIRAMNQKTAEDYKKTRCWSLAYQNLLACEYYLCTKDKTVLPVIEKLSNVIAGGRSGVGTWSHGIANLNQNFGKPYGMASAYGAMNQISVTCAMSLYLAQKCGVNNEVIDTAIKKTLGYFSFYVEKGCLPYGDHQPGRRYDNNGSSSHAAVLFNIVGNKEATRFFTKLSLASKNDRESGHTGPFFSRLWGPLGASCGGKYAAIGFSNMTRPLTETERRPNGRFIYQSSLKREDKGKYRNWDTTGVRLLEYCLPRKQLYITGKGGSVIEAFSESEVKSIIQVASISPTNKTAKELMTSLRHWSPLVRKHAAIELGKKDSNHVDELLIMLSGTDTYARYGACLGLKHAGRKSEAAVQALIKYGLNSDSTTMRYYAIRALTLDSKLTDNSLGTISRIAIPELFKIVLKEYPNEARTWTRNYATYALSSKTLMDKASWEKQPPKERLVALKKMIKVDDGGARSAISSVYRNLTKKEIATILPEIYQAIKVPAPSGVMFGKGVRSNGLRVLAENHIKEGVPLGAYYLLDEPGHGGYAKRNSGIPAMESYGQALKEYFPRLEKVIAKYKSRVKRSLQKIKDTPAPKLITIKDFMRKNSGNP